MSVLLKSVVGATGNITPPSRGLDGSALPPPDAIPTENWDDDLAKYAHNSGENGEYNNEQTFTDAPSAGGSGAIVKTFDEIMEAERVAINDAAIMEQAKRLQDPNAGIVSDRARPEDMVEDLEPEELVEVGVDVPDIGTIPFNYAEAYWDDNFLALAVHPDHKTINFKPPTKDNIKVMTFVIEKLGKKFTVVPLCQRLNSCTKSGLPLQLFRVKAVESVEVENG